MPGGTLVKQGCFDADVMNAINTGNDWILATNANLVFPYTSFGTAITLLPLGHAAGLYSVSIYAVITTTITTATSWLFTLGYTDPKQAQTPTLSTSSTMTAGTIQQATYNLYSTGATALTHTPTSASAAAGVIAYVVTVQRLA